MEKKLWPGGSLVLLIILLGILLVMSNSNQLQAASAIDASFRSHLCVNLRGSEYFSQMTKKARLGQPVSNSKFDFSRLGISQPTSGKRILVTFSNSGCSGCRKFQPLFEEWQEKYAEHLEIISVLYGPTQTNEKTKADLIKAGLQVVTFPELTGLIDPQYEEFESLLIDPEDQVIYGLYSFDLPKWKQIDALITSFVMTGEIKEAAVESLQQDLPFSFEKMTDIFGQEYAESDFLGQPTVWFLNWPQFTLNSFLYPIINNIQGKFGSEINLALVLYNNDHLAGITEEYYLRYNIRGSFVKQGMEDLTQLAEREGLVGLPIFHDQEWQLFNYSSLETTPTVVICDPNLRVREVLSLGRCLQFGADTSNLTVEQVLIELFY